MCEFQLRLLAIVIPRYLYSFTSVRGLDARLWVNDNLLIFLVIFINTVLSMLSCTSQRAHQASMSWRLEFRVTWSCWQVISLKSRQSSANSFICTGWVTVSTMSLIYMLNNNGPRTLPWGHQKWQEGYWKNNYQLLRIAYGWKDKRESNLRDVKECWDVQVFLLALRAIQDQMLSWSPKIWCLFAPICGQC